MAWSDWGFVAQWMAATFKRFGLNLLRMAWSCRCNLCPAFLCRSVADAAPGIPAFVRLYVLLLDCAACFGSTGSGENKKSYCRKRNRALGPEIVYLLVLNGPLLPQNPLEKVGGLPPTFSSVFYGMGGPLTSQKRRFLARKLDCVT
jgi:hypothetical protein